MTHASNGSQLDASPTDTGDLFDKIAAENKAKRAERSGTIGGSIRNAFNEWIF